MSETHERAVVHRKFKLFECSAEEVWAALTDPRALGAWLCNEASVDLRVGGAFEFRGDLVFGRGGGQRITALEPRRLLRFTWPLGDSEHDVAEVTWRLEPQLGMTRLVVEEALSFEGAGRPRGGWLASGFPLTNTYLPQLSAYLELGFCPVRVDANTDSNQLVIEMLLPGVTTRDAFAAVSEPGHLNAWLTDAVKLEPRKDGEFSFVLEGESEVAHETVRELEPDKSFATSSWPPPHGAVRYTIEAAGDDDGPAARIAFVQSGFVDKGQFWGVFYGWQGFMLSLANYLLRGVQKPGNTETDERILEIDLPAAPARVWRALTDSEELTSWFCEHADVDLEAGRYDFWGRYTPSAPGRDVAHHPVLAALPERRLRYAWAVGRQPGWHYAKEAVVEFTLSPLDGGAGTRLRVVRENEGHPTATGAQPDHFWWGSLFHLRAWLELGRPGPRFDYTWPCKNGEFEVHAEIDAPRELVFQELFSEYDGAPEPGSPESQTLRWGHAPGGGTRMLEVSRGHSFSVEYLFSGISSPNVLEYRFEEQGGRTRITLTQSGFRAGMNVGGVASGFWSRLFDLAWRLETGDTWPPPLDQKVPPGVPPSVTRYGVRVLAGSLAHAPVATEPIDPAEYIGVYEELAIPGQTCRIVEEKEGLWLEHVLGKFDLVPRGEDRFTLRGAASVEVRRDEEGRVDGMTLNFGTGNLPLRRLADGEAARPRVPLSEQELGRYAGHYRFRETGIVVLDVAIRGGNLTVKASGMPRGTVLPSSEPHTFCGVGFARHFEFHIGEDGVSYSVTVSGDQGLLPFRGEAERIVPFEPGEPDGLASADRKPLDLGRITLCVNTSDVQASVDFYRRLGFEPHSFPGLVSQGWTTLTFMDFLQDLLVNPRGVNVAEVAGQLSSRGLEPVSHTPGGGGLVPITELPADGSGAFTVVDPDGNQIFFNTHPPELVDYARWQEERPEPTMEVPVTLPLGQLLLCLDVTDLAASIRFYLDLGFALEAETEDSATFTALPPHTTTALAPSAYPVLLRRAETAKAHLAFRCEDPKAVAASIRALGIDVEETPPGPAFVDPDGRRVALL